MNLGALRSLAQLRLGDKDTRDFDPDLIDTFLNEALRAMAYETLLLEDLDSSLTYASANDGFAVPSDFIKVKHLKWVDSQSAHHEIPAVSLSRLYEMRNAWVSINEDTADALTPYGYTIQEGYIVIDSTSQTSPYLYYYKYDAALSADTGSPSFDSEYHSALIDYVMHKLKGDLTALKQWEFTLRKMKGSKMKQTKGLRARYVGL